MNIQACHRLFNKTAALIILILGSGFLFSLSPARANGPIPFSQNFDNFAGSGFAAIPLPGQLDSNIWRVTGFSDGTMAFGDTQAAGDFARGVSSGGETTGGIYAFDVGGGNIILGVQPTGSDFLPGEIVLRLQNNTGLTITQLDLLYNLWYLNDQPRANSLNLAYSSDDTAYTNVAALDFTTPQVADALGWQFVPRSATISGLNIPNGDFFYLKWTGDDVSGAGARDEYGLDNIQVSASTTDTPPTVANSTPADGATNILPNASLNLTFSESVTVTGDWFNIDCTTSGAHTAAVNGGPQNYTLTPDTNFANGETCTVTILAAQIADQDGPPDSMAVDYTFSFTVAAVISGWIINEVHADPDSVNGDANGDGIVSAGQDEFVEIVNNTGSFADISGWTLSDDTGVRHTFPGGTSVPDQCAIVVFGGGVPTGTFGNAVIQTAGTLGLNNTPGDTITLNNGLVTQATYTYGTEGNDNQSLTRDPDLTGPDPLVKHSTATGAGGRLFSPGTQINGSLFPGCIISDTPPSVITTTPVNGATDIAIDTNITINFSEFVTATTPWFNIDCAVSGAHTAAVSGGPQNYTLNLNTGFANNETCTVTILAVQIADQDDPSENMTADYIFTFETITPPDPLLIGEFLYDGLTPSTEGDEFVEVCNPNPNPVNLTGYKVGDEETQGGGESMYNLPVGEILAPDACLIVAKNAAQFQARFGLWPNYEVIVSGSSYTDTLSVPNLSKYTVWGSGNWALANDGDELLIAGPSDQIIDKVAYRNGDYTGLEPDATAPQPNSLQRVWPIDTNSMPNDFVRAAPTPGMPLVAPAPPASPPPAALPGGMYAYWGDLHSHTSFSDGAGPPHYALAMARAAGLHFLAITDHDHYLTLAKWANTLSQTINATTPGAFVALRGVEWTGDPAGHVNLFNIDVIPNHTDPQFDTLSKLYDWLIANPTVIAQFNHPDPAYGGNFDNFALNSNAVGQVCLQEIGNNGQGYLTFEPAFVQTNAIGWRVGPTNNSDTHLANWGFHASTRTGIVAPALTESDLLAAMRARRVFATEDSNLALTLRLANAWMGSVLTATGQLPLVVDFIDPDPEPLTLFVYDGNLPLATASLLSSTGQWTTTVNARPGHYFWAKVVQADGDTAYTTPVWIEGQSPPEAISINEILPAPHDWDWDGNGLADYNDEWIELYNPLDQTVGLGGWRLADGSGLAFNIPLGVSIPPHGFATFYHAQTNFSLNNDGDTVTLTHPTGVVVDSFSYDHTPGYNESWCRLPDGQAKWSDNCGPSPQANNWEKQPAGPLKVNIFEAKRLTLGAWVKVRGRVTAPPGLLGARKMYIQDDTAGILIYLPKDQHNYNLGDKVEVTGNLAMYHEEFEISVDERSDVKFLEPGLPPPPLPIATTSLLEPYEGMLVMLQGPAVQFKGWSTLWVDDGTGWAKVYLLRSTGVKKPYLEAGTPISVVGIVSQYADEDEDSRNDYRLLPRYQTDLILPAPTNWPALLPETGIR